MNRLIESKSHPRLAARAESADVLQEVFLDATKQIAGYLRRPDVDFYVWLRSITMQRLAKFHRFHLRAQCRAVSCISRGSNRRQRVSAGNAGNNSRC